MEKLYCFDELFDEIDDEATLDSAIDQVVEVMQAEGYEINGYDDLENYALANHLVFDEYGLMLNYKTRVQKMGGAWAVGCMAGIVLAMFCNLAQMIGLM